LKIFYMALKFKKIKVDKKVNYGFLDKQQKPVKFKNRIGLGQVHQNRIICLSRPTRKRFFAGFDGSITNQKGITLTVNVADCFPIYLYDAKNKTVGLLHSGWRGTVRNISGRAIAMMVKQFSSKAKNIRACIGPGIRSCHFEIKKDVINKFKKYPDAIIKKADGLFVDLPNIIKTQLTKTGVALKNIQDCKECTFCDAKKYFSFRRDKHGKPKTMLAYISLVA